MYIIIISGNISVGQDFWIQKDSIKGPPRSGIATFVLGNRGYAVGGLLGNESTRKVYSYSINQDDWDDETALGGVQGGGLERNLSCGFSLNNNQSNLSFIYLILVIIGGSFFSTFLGCDFGLIFFSISFYATGVPWVSLSLGDLAVKILVALLMLIPFRLLLGTFKVSKA